MVPSLVLKEFEHIILRTVAGVDHLHGTLSLAVGELVLLGGADGLDVVPSHGLTLPDGIAPGAIASTDITAIIHDTPVFHALVVIGTTEGGGIEVGEAETV